jgi:hypothetical protein
MTANSYSPGAIERARAQHIRDETILNYTIADFCAVFAVSPRAAFKLIAQGEVEALKIGARTAITAESAMAWRARCPRIVPAALRRHQERKAPAGGNRRALQEKSNADASPR